MLPSSTELTYFYEVALSSSLTVAARKLNVTQPSLSMAIKRLETNLRATLFYRQKTGVTLTRAGEALFNEVKDLIVKWDKLKLHVQSMHHDIKGRVTVGCNSMMTPFIANLISNLLNKHPALEVHLVSENSQILTEMVAKTSVDIAIVLNPAEHADLVVKKIIDTDLTFWTGLGDKPLQTLSSGEAVIICDTNIPQTHQLLNELARNGISYARISSANSLETIANLTINGCGVGILPSCFATALYKNKLQRIENAPYCRNEMCLIYRKENKQVESVQTIINAMRMFIEQFFGSAVVNL